MYICTCTSIETCFILFIIVIIIIAYTCSYCRPVIIVTGFKAFISHIFNITDIGIGEILTLTCCYHQGFPGPPGPAGVPGVEGPQGDNVSWQFHTNTNYGLLRE